MKMVCVAKYNNKKIVGSKVDGAAPLAGDKAAVEAAIKAAIENKYKLEPGRTDRSQSVEVAGQQCPVGGCH